MAPHAKTDFGSRLSLLPEEGGRVRSPEFDILAVLDGRSDGGPIEGGGAIVASRLMCGCALGPTDYVVRS